VQTGATPGTPVSQSIQSRLDSYAVITDFGATGDGSTDDTAAINRALSQLYTVQNNTQVRRSLFFPAGTYIVTDTIVIPSFARMYGEGANSSIISFNIQNWAANTAYAQGVLVYYVANGAAYYRSIAPVPANWPALRQLTAYWAAESLPGYIAQTADAQGNTGVNILTAPQNIEVTGMAFQTNQLNTGILIEKPRTARSTMLMCLVH
jgi:hypothetical protein